MGVGTEWYFLKGKGSWVTPHKVNQWGKWSMKLYPDPETLSLLLELQKEKGIKNKIEKDDDGWWVRLNRPAELKLRTGKTVGMKPPEVLDGNYPIKDDEGNVVGYRPLVEPIGNGSDVIAKVEVYPYSSPMSRDGKKEWAMRWFSVRVDTLIPFKKDSFDDGATNAIAGFENQTRQLF